MQAEEALGRSSRFEALHFALHPGDGTSHRRGANPWFVSDSALEGGGFEPSVPGNGGLSDITELRGAERRTALRSGVLFDPAAHRRSAPGLTDFAGKIAGCAQDAMAMAGRSADTQKPFEDEAEPNATLATPASERGPSSACGRHRRTSQ
jgi:hypothetical protein